MTCARRAGRSNRPRAVGRCSEQAPDLPQRLAVVTSRWTVRPLAPGTAPTAAPSALSNSWSIRPEAISRSSETGPVVITK
jgi:hypothetical protein